MEINIVGAALAIAMKEGRFGAAEHKTASDYIVKNSSSPSEMAENLMRIGNVSAIRQWGEKHGYVARNVQNDALAIAFEAAQEKMASEKLNGEKK